MIDGGNQFPKVQQIGASLPLAEKDSARRNTEKTTFFLLWPLLQTLLTLIEFDIHLRIEMLIYQQWNFPSRKDPKNKESTQFHPQGYLKTYGCHTFFPHISFMYFFNASAADKLINVSWINIGTPHLRSMEVWGEFDNFLDFIYLHSSTLLYRKNPCHNIRKHTCMETMNKLNSHKMQWKKYTFAN